MAPPTLTSSTPAALTARVPVWQNIILNFSENVIAVAGKNITIKKTSDDSVVETIDATANSGGSVTMAFNRVNPSSYWPFITEMYILIDVGAFKNGSDENYAGISSTTALSFTTRTENPIIESSTPANNATGVAVNANIVLNFNQPVAKVSGKNITIKKTSDDSVVATIDARDGQITGGVGNPATNSQITINPSSNLPFNTEMYILIDARAFKTRIYDDYAGISSTTALSFTTGSDNIVPILSNRLPKGIDNITKPTIVLTFDETVVAGSGNITIKRLSDDTVIQTIAIGSFTINSNIASFTLTSELDFNNKYYINIAATVFDDDIGNSYTGVTDKSLTFSTKKKFSSSTYKSGGWENPDYLNPVSGNKQMYGGGNTKYSAPYNQGRSPFMFSIAAKRTSTKK